MTEILSLFNLINFDVLKIDHLGMQTVAMMITALLLPKLRITNPLGAVLMVVGISVVNTYLWNTALFFKIPDSLTSQTLTLFLANGALFWGLVKILPGIESSGILPCLVAPLVFTLVNLGTEKYGKDIEWREIGERGVKIVQDLRGSLLGEKQIDSDSDDGDHALARPADSLFK